MTKPSILFIKHFSTNAKFISNDIEILNSEFKVDVYVSKTSKNLSIIFTLINQFFYTIFRIQRYELIYIWFADYHSFIPVLLSKIFNKKSVIAVGGYEATKIPEINCGTFDESTIKKRLRSFCVKFSFRNCSLILPVDESLVKNENKYVYSDHPGNMILKDGILNFMPDLKTPIHVLHTGFDPEYFKKNENISKEKIILSVGYSPNENEFRRKGFDMLIEAASLLPGINFVIIGVNESQKNKYKDLANVHMYNSVSMDELRKYYSEAKVFAQLSLFEGLPSSLCEAMLYECIPVGSNVNGIPNVINGTGFIVQKKNKREIAEKLKSALEIDNDFGYKARQRVIQNFSLEKRKEKLLKILDSLLSH
jgi:glycosyltransferase involved in cell wall biosynthesis